MKRSGISDCAFSKSATPKIARIPARARNEIVDHVGSDHVTVVQLPGVLRLVAHRIEDGVDRARGSGLEAPIVFIAEVELLLVGDLLIDARDQKRLRIQLRNVGPERQRARNVYAESSGSETSAARIRCTGK